MQLNVFSTITSRIYQFDIPYDIFRLKNLVWFCKVDPHVFPVLSDLPIQDTQLFYSQEILLFEDFTI